MYVRIIMFVLTLMFVSSAHAEDKVIRMAVDAPYAPFAYFDKETGKLSGFDVDIAEAVCRQLNIKCDIQVVPFDEIIPSIVAGKIDVGVAGMAKKADREKLVLFSDKYFRSSSLFIEVPGSVTVENGGLKGKKIAVQAKTTQEDYLIKTYGDIATIVPMKSFEDITAATLKKEVDVAFVDGLPGYHKLKSDEGLGLEIVGDPVTLGNASCMVLNKELVSLRDDINKAIQDLRANGEYDRINRKYFEFNIY